MCWGKEGELSIVKLGECKMLRKCRFIYAHRSPGDWPWTTDKTVLDGLSGGAAPPDLNQWGVWGSAKLSIRGPLWGIPASTVQGSLPGLKRSLQLCAQLRLAFPSNLVYPPYDKQINVTGLRKVRNPLR